MTDNDTAGDGLPDEPRNAPGRTAPELDEDTVQALGTLSEALEWVERARGHLYEFHQLTGHADQTVQKALDELDKAGHSGAAARIRQDVLGRNVIDGRWTFQLVEEYDDGYYQAIRSAEAAVRGELAGGRRHVFEARMKDRTRRDAGRDVWGSGG